MKGALTYLTVTKLKNQLKGVIKSPAKLIYGVVLIAMLVLSSMPAAMDDTPGTGNIQILIAIVTLFYLMMFVMVFISGSASNNPMFTLSDVTLLFPSPLSSNHVLFYGLLRQLGVSLLLGFFLLFQYNWMHSIFNITYGHLLLIIAGYGLILFLAQFCAMAVYTRTSDMENAGGRIRLGAYILVAAYIAWAAFTCRGAIMDVISGAADYTAILEAGADFFSTMPGLLFPVAGWTAGIIGGIFTGNWVQLGICLILLIAAFIVLLTLILTCKKNYYEDVLSSAEAAQSAVTAQKEGKIGEVVPKNVKVGKTGLKKGWGASAIYYKHKVENRRSGVFFISNMSLLFAVIIIAAAFFLSLSLEEDTAASLAGVFAMATYMQLFSCALGRFNRELTKPYIYLMPEPPLKKMIYGVKETLVADFFEALLVFIPVGLILSLDPISIALCVMARLSFALLFTAGNVIVERVFGTVSSKVLIFMFYFIVLIVMAAPGLIIGIVLMEALPFPGMITLMVTMSAVNIVVGVLGLFLCRNLLQYAELNNR